MAQIIPLPALSHTRLVDLPPQPQNPPTDVDIVEAHEYVINVRGATSEFLVSFFAI